MSDRVKHSKRSQRSFGKNDVVKKLFMAMAFKRKDEQEQRKIAKTFKEMLKKDIHVGDVVEEETV